MHGFVIGRPRSAIIGLLLLLATWRNIDSCSGLYQPVEVYANGDDCALVLNGPGRTNVFDYTYNLLRGSFSPTAGSQTCITYDAVNRAYIEARKRINVAHPKNRMWRPEDLATVGELLLDISTNLAETYGLTADDIENSLPLIDTSKTLISEVCPNFLSNVECRPGKYRRYDALCTNLKNPTWGSTLTPFTRLMRPRFADGLTTPRISVTGRDLPLSRVVSRTMHPDEGYHDHAGTVMVIAWGQFLDHDYTLTGTPLDSMNRNDPEECCHRPPHLKNPYCNEILIPKDDYFFRLFNVKCMDFVRAFPAVRPGCRLGARVPFNLLTGVLDGNTVYGITEAFARKLRTPYGGLLRMNPVFEEYGLKDLLPLKLDIPDEGCTRPNRSMYCFEAGEIRVNEQLVLTCMHTLMAREHNRIAKGLGQVNPHWDDETLFQEARRIVIAEIQHITYNEFLPILLGKDVMEKFGLLLEKNDYWNGYDDTVNPGVIDAFAAAAFRFGHSLLPTAVERWSKAHKFIASKRLSDLIRRPYDLYRAGVFDEYVMGLMNQVAQAMDDSITQEVTNHLFKKAGAKFGLDLVSFNMQRGREFGIPSYMEFRKFCGLPWADSFEELFGSMPNETIRRYSSIFELPADVDLWSGGVSERPLPGSMLGPTFACIIATQFSYSRSGDRFWYELPNQPSSFTLEQLNEIRKIKLARVICDNTDLIDTIQIYPMVLPDHEINPRVPCRSGVLPSIDLTKWAEYPTQNHEHYSVENEQNKSTLDLTGGKSLEKIETRTDNEVDINIATDFPYRNIVTIVETIRRKNSKGISTLFETLNNEEKEITRKRSKRSSGKKSNYLGTEKQVPLLNRFYRHPNLSYEEQEKRDKFETEAVNRNFGNTFNKRVLDVLNSSDPKLPIESMVNQSRKHNYVPVFPNCNEKDDSKFDDLNRSLKNLSFNDEKGGSFSKEVSVSAVQPQMYFDQDHSTVSTSVKEQRKDRNYINIRDHQKNMEDSTSSDIPDYDPEKIPYVEVPDYSDIREESLDEEDRRAKKWKMNKKDVNIAGPNFEKSSKNSNNSKSGRNKSGTKANSEKSKKSEWVGNSKNGEKRKKTDRTENSTSQLDSIIFDINEYRKPFNLDEFLKDDPIMKKLELLEKETHAKYGESRKRVSGYLNESESDNAYKEPAVEREDFAEDGDGFDYSPKSSRFDGFVGKFAEANRDGKAGEVEESSDSIEANSREEFYTEDDSMGFLESSFADEE